MKINSARIASIYMMALICVSCVNDNLIWDFNSFENSWNSADWNSYDNYVSKVSVDGKDYFGSCYDRVSIFTYCGPDACDKTDVDSLYFWLYLSACPEVVDTMSDYVLTLSARINRTDWNKGEIIAVQSDYESHDNFLIMYLTGETVWLKNNEQNDYDEYWVTYNYRVDEVELFPLEPLPDRTVVGKCKPLKYRITATLYGTWDDSVHNLDCIIEQAYDFQRWGSGGFTNALFPMYRTPTPGAWYGYR